MKKVLLIAFYFNQTNEIASKRLRGLAKYLPQFGWEAIVIVPKLDDNILNNDKYDFKVIETDYIDMLDKWLNKFKISSQKTGDNSGLVKELDNKTSYDINKKASIVKVPDDKIISDIKKNSGVAKIPYNKSSFNFNKKPNIIKKLDN